MPSPIKRNATARFVLLLLLVATPSLLRGDESRVGKDNAIVEALLRIPDAKLDDFPQHAAAVQRYLDRVSGTARFLSVVEKLNLHEELPRVAAMLTKVPFDTESTRAAQLLLDHKRFDLVDSAIKSAKDEESIAALSALGYINTVEAKEFLLKVFSDEARSRPARTAAAAALGRMGRGQRALLQLAQDKRISPEFEFVVADSLLGSTNEEIRVEASKYFKPSSAGNSEAIPPIRQLVEMRGSAERGKAVFSGVGTCAKCHKVLGEGKEVGPDLSEIGSKLSREDMYVAILIPSAAVSHNYETYTVLTADDSILTGTLINQTDDAVTIRSAEAIETTIPMSDVEELKKQAVSLMPADLQKLMPVQSLVDLVDYLVLLKKKGEQGFDQVATKKAPPVEKETSREAKDAIAGLDVAEGLEIQLYSHEPMMLSPTSMDIDHLGRIWVGEAVNYRHFRNPSNEERSEGDRIVVLEDTNKDGRSDKITTFYQGTDIDSPHGVCVLGKDVIVSAGANVWVFTDDDGDLKADRKRALFTGIEGVQHDHGIHGFTFGVDGKLYFNFGNEAKRIYDAEGKPIVDSAGNIVEDARRPYQQGMAFRCNVDGSDFETLGWNFRNNWELCVDSFGTIWQSDNDDDGNRGTRINYVMEFGNYGYRDEKTGDTWKVPRTGMETEVMQQHWHLNDPGVVPNLLQTGAGSPTGITVYEGTLLPKQFRNQIIHCDPGPNVVRAYPVEANGAGYSASIVKLVEGVRDQWFRPVDVASAPDGSLFIADWYDPGVGGHRMGDQSRGRIFRIVPSGYANHAMPIADFTTITGAIAALNSPNVATRYLAHQALVAFGPAAVLELNRIVEGESDSRHRARAAWILATISDNADAVVKTLLADAESDLRIVGIRIARQHRLDLIAIAKSCSGDPSPQVRREVAIALRLSKSPEMPKVWAQLAAQHTDGDRWYLEALGIGSDLRSDECFLAWIDLVGDRWNTPAGRDIVWRTRSSHALSYLAKIILSTDSPSEQDRYFRAMDFHDRQEVAKALKENLAVK